MKQDWQVIVVGAGAAGLYAAATAAAKGRRTLLLEKNRKLGVKILMSGGTRCNITHNTNWRGIANAFGKRQGRFLKFALATLPPETIVQRFHEWSVATKIEDTGKVFPVSNKAIDVRDALVKFARDSRAIIENETTVESIRKTADGFQIATDGQEFRCESVIVTAGGQSYPGCGTTGDGYDWLRQLGHQVVAPRPALTPLRVNQDWVRDLAGVTLPEVGLSIRLLRDTPTRKNAKASDRTQYDGSFLFTHKGCSGPAVLNISRVVTDPLNNCRKQLVCDWLPDRDEQQLRESVLNHNATDSSRSVSAVLTGLIPKRLVETLCEISDVPVQRPLAELGKKQRSRLVTNIKQCPLEIDGTLGFAKAEVTAGGVDLSEVDPQTMASRVCPGLFLAGEILDVDGPIGGYNFQAAFSTGFVAGSNA